MGVGGRTAPTTAPHLRRALLATAAAARNRAGTDHLAPVCDILIAAPKQSEGRMPEKMPEKSWQFIEAECLKVARLAQGCSDLRAVRIGRTKPSGSGPNWEVLGFSPELPPLAESYAREAIDRVRQRYALAPTPKL